MFPAPGAAELRERAKERVLVLRTPGASVVVDVETLRDAGVLEVVLGETPIVALSLPRPSSSPILPPAWERRVTDLEGWRRSSAEDLARALHEEPVLAESLSVELLLELPMVVRLALMEQDRAAGSRWFTEDARLAAAQRGLAADVRAYQAPAEPLVWVGPRLVDRGGGAWLVTDAALIAPDGTRYARVPGHLAFRFATRR